MFTVVGFAYSGLIIYIQPSPAESEVPEEQTRIKFTSSPLWTESRKATVREQVQSFDMYLSKAGIIKPPEILPLLNISEGKQVSWGFVGPANPPFDQRQIPIPTGDLTPIRIRTLYANYVFDNLLSVHQKPGRATLTLVSWIYSEYFPASSLNIVPDLNATRLNGWLVALWDIRKELGQDFTDRALMFSVKAPVAYDDD